jgi:signal transduction histidine kinase
MAVVTLFFIGAISLGVHQHREYLQSLEATHKGWLQRYSQSFLNDLQVGNILSVKKDLASFLETGNFSFVELSFGNTTLRVGEPQVNSDKGQNRDTTNPLVRRLVDYFTPKANFKLTLLDEHGGEWGTFYARMSSEIVYGSVLQAFQKFLVYGFSLFLMAVGFHILLVDKQMKQLHSLIHHIREFSLSEFTPEKISELLKRPPHMVIKEYGSLYQGFRSAVENIVSLQSEVEKKKIDTELSKLARQVAHDVRSPLSALNVVMTTTTNLPENVRVMMRTAVNRIQDIASNLLEENRRLSFKGHNCKVSGLAGLKTQKIFIEYDSSVERIQKVKGAG